MVLNKEIGVKDFLKIAKKEEEISERELLEAFQALDTDKNGSISVKELKDLFTTVILNFLI
jgi:Ca2+-binding EF-hand superfamily protein